MSHSYFGHGTTPNTTPKISLTYIKWAILQNTFTFKVSQFFIVSYYSEYVHIYFFSRNPKLKKPGTIIGM